jgi:hypothetical protein
VGWDTQGLHVHTCKNTGDRILDDLGELQSERPTPKAVAHFVRGWVGELGPTYPHVDRRKIHAWLEGRVQARALDGMPTHDHFERLWSQAFERWQAERQNVNQVDSQVPLFL